MPGERRKGGSAWITLRLWSRRSPNFGTGLFECERPFIYEPVVVTGRAVPSARLLDLDSKLYPSNMQCMLNKDLTQFMPSLSRERQNRAQNSETPNSSLKWLITWREESPSTRKILEGGTTFPWVYLQKFWSVWLPIREGIKDAGDNVKNTSWALLFSLLLLISTFQQQLPDLYNW